MVTNMIFYKLGVFFDIHFSKVVNLLLLVNFSKFNSLELAQDYTALPFVR